MRRRQSFSPQRSGRPILSNGRAGSCDAPADHYVRPDGDRAPPPAHQGLFRARENARLRYRNYPQIVTRFSGDSYYNLRPGEALALRQYCLAASGGRRTNSSALASHQNRSRPWCLPISTATAKPGNSPVRARSESVLLTRRRPRRLPGGPHDVSGDTHHESGPEQRRQQIEARNGQKRRHDKARAKQTKRVLFNLRLAANYIAHRTRWRRIAETMRTARAGRKSPSTTS